MSTESPSSLQTLVVILSTQALTYFSHTAQGCSHYPLSVRKKLGCRTSEQCSLSHAHLCIELGGVHSDFMLWSLMEKQHNCCLGLTHRQLPRWRKGLRHCYCLNHSTFIPFSNRKTNHITFSLQPTLGPLDGDFPICK